MDGLSRGREDMEVGEVKRIKELKMTCGACPSQWEGFFEDGGSVYIRYRWGYLSVEDTPRGELAYFGRQVGDGFHGVMTTEEMLEITGLELTEDAKCEPPVVR